jgi:hypothetical protein
MRRRRSAGFAARVATHTRELNNRGTTHTTNGVLTHTGVRTQTGKPTQRQWRESTQRYWELRQRRTTQTRLRNCKKLPPGRALLVTKIPHSALQRLCPPPIHRLPPEILSVSEGAALQATGRFPALQPNPRLRAAKGFSNGQPRATCSG